MWALLEFALLGGVVLLAITEFFYPLFTGKPLFQSFRKRMTAPPTEPQEEPSLEDKLDDAKEKIKEVKSVQEEVNKKFRSAEELKNESDNLFNN